MKSKEEIEQLASKRFIIKQFIGEDDYNRNETIAARRGFVNGYFQCQEDMADKKYTKEDVLKAGEIGEINHHDYKHIVSLLDEARKLNKQD